jgi:hypothetical protein
VEEIFCSRYVETVTKQTGQERRSCTNEIWLINRKSQKKDILVPVLKNYDLFHVVNFLHLYRTGIETTNSEKYLFSIARPCHEVFLSAIL